MTPPKKKKSLACFLKCEGKKKQCLSKLQYSWRKAMLMSFNPYITADSTIPLSANHTGSLLRWHWDPHVLWLRCSRAPSSRVQSGSAELKDTNRRTHKSCVYRAAWNSQKVTLPSVQCRLPWALSGKESACNWGDAGLIPGLGRSSGEGNGNSPWDYWLVNPTDRGARQATVRRIARARHNFRH